MAARRFTSTSLARNEFVVDAPNATIVSGPSSPLGGAARLKMAEIQRAMNMVIMNQCGRYPQFSCLCGICTYCTEVKADEIFHAGPEPPMGKNARRKTNRRKQEAARIVRLQGGAEVARRPPKWWHAPLTLPEGIVYDLFMRKFGSPQTYG